MKMVLDSLSTVKQIDIYVLHPHPYNQKIYGNEDVSELAERIKASNWIKPLVTTPDGRIISGHRRWQAALLLGYTSVPVERRTFVNETEELEALLLENASREKSVEQRVREGEMWRQIESEKALQRMLAGVASTPDPNLDEGGKTSKKVAEKVGMKKTNYEKAAQVVKTADQLARSGKETEADALLKVLNSQSVDAASKVLRMPDPKRSAVLETISAGDAKDVKTAERVIKEKKREAHRDENRQTVEQAPTIEDALKTAKFSTIVIDPPWDWGDEGDADQFGRARPTYATMSLDELLALPVGQFADDDSHIYLWITNRSLPKGFDMLSAWGFRYVTCITWVKPSFGMGNYFRGQTEHLLFGVKGSQPLKRRNAPTYFQAPRGPNGHSSKPLASYDFIESCSPGPYLEIFARSERPGWMSWGGEL